MTMTSAEANKLLRKLNDDLYALRSSESLSKDFLASVGEDVEACRPEYSYEETQKGIAAIEKQIRTLKHAINLFNVTHKVPGFDMTIDEMLIYIPQLTQRKNKLGDMKSRLPRQRESSGRMASNLIDYRYLNYDVKQAAADYDAVADELSRAQTALDVVNTTEPFEVVF